MAEYVGKTNWKLNETVMPEDFNRIEQRIIDLGAEIESVSAPLGQVTLTKSGWKRESYYWVQTVDAERFETNMQPFLTVDPDTMLQMLDDKDVILCINKGGVLRFVAYNHQPNISIVVKVIQILVKPNPNVVITEYYSNVVGGGIDGGTPIPEQVTDFEAQNTSTESELQITLTWINPSSDFAGLKIIRKEDMAPSGLSDGIEVYNGTSNTTVDKNGLTMGKTYYYRAFPFNESGMYQTDASGIVAHTLTPKAAPQVTSFTAKNASSEQELKVNLSWTNPNSIYFEGVKILKKLNSQPSSNTDGEEVYRGKGTSFDDKNVALNQNIYYRAFAYNAVNDYTEEEAVSSVTITPGLPSGVTNLELSPNKEQCTITWKNPQSLYFAGVVLIRKEGSKPENQSDGQQLYKGAAESYTDGGLQNQVNYFYRLFTYNANNEFNTTADNTISYKPNLVPTGYAFLQTITENTVWTPPEDGFYRVIAFGKCADGSSGTSGTEGRFSSKPGGYGGASGGFACSLLSLTTKDRINCTVTPALTSFGDYLSATGATGQSGVGKGSGGNLYNLDGFKGGAGGTSNAAGKPGENSGASGGKARSDGRNNYGGGGGGGGARIPVPEVDYDDSIYTTYTVTTLSSYRGGMGSIGNRYDRPANPNYNGQPGSSYPAFNPESPVIYGGGNGGGGGNSGSDYEVTYSGGRGSAGSPACIIIEKGTFD